MPRDPDLGETLTWQQCPKRGISAGEIAAVAEGEEV